MKRVCVFQDTQQLERSVDLIEPAQIMYGAEACEIFLVVPEQEALEFSGYAEHIVCIAEGVVEAYDQLGYCEILEKLHRKYCFDAILIPATPFGRMVAPRLAKRLRTGLVADVTEVRIHDETLEMIRPACSGRILAGIENLGQGPVMMSIRSGAFSYTGCRDRKSVVIAYTEPVSERSRIRLLKAAPKPASYDIRESRVLVSGGGGVLRHFAKLCQLADMLNGQVAASRKVIDNGIAARSIQVGHSGKRVSPGLYIALGIDGAIQHMEGLKHVGKIIAVNISKRAPICSRSDIIVVGDAVEFIDKLTARIAAYRNEIKGAS